MWFASRYTHTPDFIDADCGPVVVHLDVHSITAMRDSASSESSLSCVPDDLSVSLYTESILSLSVHGVANRDNTLHSDGRSSFVTEGNEKETILIIFSLQ